MTVFYGYRHLIIRTEKTGMFGKYSIILQIPGSFGTRAVRRRIAGRSGYRCRRKSGNARTTVREKENIAKIIFS